MNYASCSSFVEGCTVTAASEFYRYTLNGYLVNIYYIKNIIPIAYPFGFSLTLNTANDYYSWKTSVNIKKYWHNVPLTAYLNDSYAIQNQYNPRTLSIDLIPKLQCIPYNFIDFPTRFIQGTNQFFNISCFLIDYKFAANTYTYALTRVNTIETLTSKAFTTSNTYQLSFYIQMDNSATLTSTTNTLQITKLGSTAYSPNTVII